MSPKKFARSKLTGDKAKNYIASNMEWLKLPEHSFLEPILTAYENKEIDDTSCLLVLQEALLSHHISCELAAAEKKLEASLNEPVKIADQYTITIYCKVRDGVDIGKRIIKRNHMDEQTGRVISWEDEEDMIYSASKFQDAQQKAYRMLVSTEDSKFAEIVNNYGPTIKTFISRNDSFAELFAKKKQPYMKNLGKKNAPLKNYAKCKNDRSIGPWNISK